MENFGEGLCECIQSWPEFGRIGLWIGKNPKNPYNFGLDLDFKSILSDCWIDTSGLD